MNNHETWRQILIVQGSPIITALEEATLLGQLCLFLWSQVFERGGIGCSYVPGDNAWIWWVGTVVWLSWAGVGIPKVMWALLTVVAMLQVQQACIVLFLGPCHFSSCCCFPLIHGAWYNVLIECFAVDHLVHRTLSVSRTGLVLCRSVCLTRWVSCTFTQSSIIGLQTYMSAVSTWSKGWSIDSWFQLTILYWWNQS